MTREEARMNLKRLTELFEEAAEQSRMLNYSVIIETLKFAASNLRPIREQVEKMKASVTDVDDDDPLCDYGHCTACGAYIVVDNFCSVCGSPLTDEAVDLLAKRLEEVLNADTGSV